MQIHELKIKIRLKKDLPFKDYINFVSKNVNYIFYNSTILRALHEKRGFKPYVVGSLYPVNKKEKVYKQDAIYTLTLRTIEEAVVGEFYKASKKTTNLDFDIEGFKSRELKLSYIDKIYTITPAVLTITDQNGKIRYWTIEDDPLLLQKRIVDNLEKKYIEFFKKSVKAPSDMVGFFKVVNQKPLVFNYKGGKIFANRFQIGFNSDEVSQKLARLSFGVGILEKNPLGFGMVVRARDD
ncbi:CRISPR-associated endoribonuclease Cas6 [Nitrosophilus labii]|uniref:CRISPR-associated endoribonuclease Cas6 n=1 Tax=Nitrosophilus labii TaxID=2706014 RepID=UPI001656FD9C|nr:CRISPR-associated endoribonuclease Cas6 [Nitrosophilus labii]